MMKVLNIIHDSVVDGEGLRTVVFFAGCPHQCLGCHNPDSWFRSNGTNMTLEEILAEIKSNPMNDVTFSGGEPFIQAKQIEKVTSFIGLLFISLFLVVNHLSRPNKLFRLLKR